MSRKPSSPRLRSLDARDLAAVSGGIIIYGSTALGGPDTAGSVGDGLSERAIMFWSAG